MLFGGFSATPAALADTWVWDGTDWTEIDPPNSPPARARGVMALDPTSGHLILFGGEGAGGTLLSDTWRWDGVNWTELTPAHHPSARVHAGAASDPDHGEIVLFGGRGEGNTFLADTWTWNGTDWTEESPTNHPSAREGPAMTFDDVHDEVVFWGGRAGTTYFEDTWTWNGSDWSNENPIHHPQERDFASMAFDPSVGEVMLFGTTVESNVTDTWTRLWFWDGTDWSDYNLHTSTPTRTTGFSMAFHEASNRLVHFGGAAIELPENATHIFAPVEIDPPGAPIAVGSEVTLYGTGITPQTVLKVYIATASGAVDVIPEGLAPTATTTTSWTGTLPFPWPLAAPNDVLLGNGYAALQLVRKPRYDPTNLVGAALVGNPSLGVPSILSINSANLSASTTDPAIAVANVETVVVLPSTLVIDGDGFANPVVNLFTAAGNIGPLTPVTSNATHIEVAMPAEAPIGPGSVQVVNGSNSRASNAVSVPIGEAVSVTGVSVDGSTVTVQGTGFNALTVVNLFASSAGNVVNVGGLHGNGDPFIALDVEDEHQLTFTRPSGLDAGPAYVQAINPPFIPFTSSGTGPGGAFTLP